jgi:L-ascorbate metabolism protein UlaG (beta-lactamase superfamily)
MKLTKFTHACIRLEQDGHVLVVDPGNFSEVEQALDGATAVLVTHEHADHIDQDRVPGLLAAADDMQLYAPASVAADLRALAPAAAGRIHTAEPETEFEVPGFRIRTFGGQHALIHPHIPVVANIGYVINDSLYHPGDSFIVPHGLAVTTVLVPVHAPWSKTGEVIDFVTAMRAEHAYPIHDAGLSDRGLPLVEKHLERIGGYYGTRYKHLSPGESVELA